MGITFKKGKYLNIKNIFFYNFNLFIFFNLIPLTIIYIFTPFISKGFPFSLIYEFKNYFYNFGLEILIIILGILLAIILTGILMRYLILFPKIMQILSKSFIYYLLLLFPATIFLFLGKHGYTLFFKYSLIYVTGIGYVSDETISLLIIGFTIFCIFYTTMLLIIKSFQEILIMKEYQSLSSLWLNSTLITLRKIPSIISIFIFVSITLKLPLNTSRFMFSILNLQSIGKQGLGLGYDLHTISFPTAFLVITIQILILNIILYLLYLLLTKKSESSFQTGNKDSSFPRNRYKSKFLLVLLSSIIIYVFSKITPLESMQKILFLRSPFYVNSSEIYSKPSLQHWLGTDLMGRDIFSMILFSIAEMIVIILIVLSLLFFLSFIFKSFIRASSNNYTDNFYDVLANFPSLPILIVIAGYILASSFSGSSLPTMIIYTLFFWPRYINRDRYNVIDENNRKSFINNLNTVIPKLIIDINLIGFLGLLPSNSLNLGMMLRSFLSGSSYIYWWSWFFPLLTLYLFISIVSKDE